MTALIHTPESADADPTFSRASYFERPYEPEWTVLWTVIATGDEEGLGATTEAHACEAAVRLARGGGAINVRVCRRDSPTGAWREVARPRVNRLQAVNARPHSVVRGRH